MSRRTERLYRRDFLSQTAFLLSGAFGLPAFRTQRGSFHQNSSQAESTRVVFIRLATLNELHGLTYEKLGRIVDGVWLACPDRTLRVLAERRPPEFLYFARRAYDVAIKGLSAPEVDEVIRRRRDQWAPQALGRVLSRLFDLETIRLEGLLRTSGDRNPNIGPQIENSLSLLQRLAGLDRYQMVSTRAFAFTILEGDSQLLATIRSALAATPSAKPPGLSSHLDKRSVWTRAMAQVAKDLGAMADAGALPFSDPTQGVFVHPAGDELFGPLRRQGEPAVRWRDGIVYVAAERHVSSQRAKKVSVDVLYADDGEFYESVEELTTAQLHRDFAARMARQPAAIHADAQREIDRLQLHQILLKRELCGRNDADSACRSVVREILADEIRLLSRSLSQSHTFSSKAGLESLSPQALIRHGDETGAADLSFFKSVASIHLPSVAQILAQIELMRRSPPN